MFWPFVPAPSTPSEAVLSPWCQRKAQYAAVYGMYEKDRRDHVEAQQAYRDKQDALRRNAAMIAAHLSWGWSTAEAIRELGEARETIFAAGPDKDRA